MSKIKFPPLQKGLTKYGEVFVISDYVHIHNNHALVMHPEYVVIVDLKSYFALRKNPDVDPDPEFENALDILEFLNGKYLSSSFWSELVSAETLILNEDEGFLQIGSKGTLKDLHYVAPLESEGDSAIDATKKVFSLIDKVSKRAPLGSRVCNIDIETLLKIAGMIGNKKDAIILEQFGTDKPVRFSYRDCPFVFGILNNNYETNESLYLDHGISEFVKNIEDLSETKVEFEVVKK